MNKQLLMLSVLCTLLFACKKKDIDSPAAAIENPVYKQLIETGFSAKDIQDLGAYYLVDGDLLFHKEAADVPFVKRYFDGLKKDAVTDPQGRHWIMPSIVSDYSIEAMKIYTADYNFNGELTDWQRSATTAMAAWAGISNTKINFTRYFNTYSGPQYINIVDDAGSLPNNVIAAAEPPSSGNPGYQIRINLDFNSNSNVPNGQRVYNLVHELGHCIGFRHTNWQLIGESQNGAIQVTTTSASQDPNSVMNGGTALNSWIGFSSDDVIAAQTVYPVGTYTNWITSPNSGKYPSYAHYYLADYSDPIGITWNASLVSTGTVTLQAYQEGVFKQTIASGIPNTGSYSYPVMNAVGTGGHSAYEVQIKIISDANPAISDFSSMFDIYVD